MVPLSQYLMGIEMGMDRGQVSVFTVQGNLVSRARTAFSAHSPHPGWVEQDPEEAIPALFACIREALVQGIPDPREIAAVSLASPGGAWIPLNSQGQALRPLLGPRDWRATGFISRLAEMIPADEYYQIAGHPIHPELSLPRYLWFREEEPEVWAQTALLSQHQDFYLARLGAEERLLDLASAADTGMADVDQGTWSQRLHEVADIPLSLHPVISPEGGRPVGQVSAAAAEATGLAPGTLLCLGTTHRNCVTLGSGLLEGGSALVFLDTPGLCAAVTEKPVRDPRGVLQVRPNEGPRNWAVEGVTPSGAGSYHWCQEIMGPERVQSGNGAMQECGSGEDAGVEKVPPGANGLTFLPYLQGAGLGPRCNPNARGALLGMSLDTGKNEIKRAVLEGIAMEMRELLDAQRQAGVVISDLCLAGTAARSRTWGQLQADVLNMPMAILEPNAGAALGAALCAGVGAGVYRDFAQAAAETVRVEETLAPDRFYSSAYDEIYERFGRFYEALERGECF